MVHGAILMTCMNYLSIVKNYNLEYEKVSDITIWSYFLYDCPCVI